MLRRFREYGPVLLVPFAWSFVTAAHLDLVGDHPVFVAHVVMAVLLGTFVVTGWREMTAGALRVWRAIILVGFGITLAGAVALATDGPASLLGVSIVGWMLLPAVGLVDTGRRVDGGATPYAAGGALSAVGAVAYLLWMLTGSGSALVALALVGVGQTAGIVAAATQY